MIADTIEAIAIMAIVVFVVSRGWANALERQLPDTPRITRAHLRRLRRNRADLRAALRRAR